MELGAVGEGNTGVSLKRPYVRKQITRIKLVLFSTDNNREVKF